jgi:hypothetical protein
MSGHHSGVWFFFVATRAAFSGKKVEEDEQ